MRPKRLVLAYNTSWYVWNFRMPLLKVLREAGYEIIVLAPRDAYTDRILAEGFGHRDIILEAKGRNPLREVGTLLSYFRAYRELKPDVVLHYTIKPNLYGSIAARFLRIPAIDNVTGLGAAFESGGFLEFAVRVLYRFAFARVAKVFFQNPDDKALFLRDGLVREAQVDLLPGSGVDLARFAPRSRGEGPFTFLYLGRLLKAKGVEDLVAAARIVREAMPGLRVVLLGKRDDEDIHGADPVLLDVAQAEGLVELPGVEDDVLPRLARADCVVLPSYYREGTPRSLLEAAAMEKPLIAADSIGTREPVVDGLNGYLCRPRDPEDLAAKMLTMASLSPEARARMGAASRRLAEERFDERIVLEKYKAAVTEALTVGARGRD